MAQLPAGKEQMLSFPAGHGLPTLSEGYVGGACSSCSFSSSLVPDALLWRRAVEGAWTVAFSLLFTFYFYFFIFTFYFSFLFFLFPDDEIPPRLCQGEMPTVPSRLGDARAFSCFSLVFLPALGRDQDQLTAVLTWERH